MRRSESLTLPLFTPVQSAPTPQVPAPPASTTALVTARESGGGTELAQLVANANGYALDVRAEASRRSYEGSFRTFEAWCARHGLEALPATSATVAVYLAALAGEGRRPATIARALAALVSVHRERGCAWPSGDPTIAKVMRGIRRRHGVAPVQKAALDDEDLARMVDLLGDSLVDRRDRALLTLGWLGAFRRSELVALRLEDVTTTAEGLLVQVRRSKGDQEGRGVAKGIPYAERASVCPVRALAAWLEASGVTRGPIFRAVDRGGRVHEGALSDRTVARVVQRVAAAAGMDPANVAGHSLRAGFITTAARRGKRIDEIMRLTQQKSERVVRGYIRSTGAFENNAAVGLV